MKESIYQTPCGTIHYWLSILSLDTTTLVFLPGLTADHRLFDKQVEYFVEKYNIIVWDAPAHASSWPFRFEFDLFDKAKWLNGILEKEEIIKPIIIGQSMGGYVVPTRVRLSAICTSTYRRWASTCCPCPVISSAVRAAPACCM